MLDENMARASAFLIDIDGTALVAEAALPGVPETLSELRALGLPYRFVTNTTSQPRSAVLAKMRRLGLTVEPEEILTAPIMARDFLLRENLLRCYPFFKADLREDFAGITWVEENPQAVIVGDLGAELSYAALNRAFRFLLDGAAFITLAQNRYFRGADGLCLDVGAIAAALAYASQKSPRLLGKPAREFFLLACAEMGVPPEKTVVIGDDLEADVGGGQAAGCRGILVRTGKFRAEQLTLSSIQPDDVLDSLADLPHWLQALPRG